MICLRVLVLITPMALFGDQHLTAISFAPLQKLIKNKYMISCGSYAVHIPSRLWWLIRSLDHVDWYKSRTARGNQQDTKWVALMGIPN